MKKTGRGVSNGVCLVSCKAFLACVLFSAVAQLYATPPRLHVDGNRIKDPNGNVVVLRGVSMIDLGSTEIWWGGAINTIDRLTNQNDANGNSPGWYTKIIRVPICPNDSPLCTNSPLTFNPRDPNEPNNPLIRALLRRVVNYCALKDVYVIIDYHHMANTYDEVAETNTFWEYMAPEFANDSHVLFELFNEPINTNGMTEDQSWDSVRVDMQIWVDTIRNEANAPHTLILVGAPNYDEILSPVVGNPILDDNIVYVSHIYPPQWLGKYYGNSYYLNHIKTCAAVYPVIMTEWGFTEDPNYGTYFNGTISNYGAPLKAFLEHYGIGNTAWCASNSVWGSPMFWPDWTLRCGEGEMGCFVKDWLYEERNEQIATLTIKTCTVTAGKTQYEVDGDSNDMMKDTFTASGTILLPTNVNNINTVGVKITSVTDDYLVYSEYLNDFSATTVNKKHKYTHSAKLTKGQAGKITSLTLDFGKGTFAVAGKNLDLTGLASPLELRFIMDSNLYGQVDETIINGKNTTIPTRLMRSYKDTLIVPPGKTKVKSSVEASSDSLSVTGEIAVEDINTTGPNLYALPVVISWSSADDTNSQTFTIPPHSFKIPKTGHLYKLNKNVTPDVAPVPNSNTKVSGTIDLDKCIFALSITKADLSAVSGQTKFGIRFGDFNEVNDINLAWEK